MVYYNPYITGSYNSLYNPTNQGFFFRGSDVPPKWKGHIHFDFFPRKLAILLMVALPNSRENYSKARMVMFENSYRTFCLGRFEPSCAGIFKCSM